MKSTLSRFQISSDTSCESSTRAENNCKINHHEEDEILSDFNNRSNSESSFITIDEDKEDSLLEFDTGSIHSDDYISESAIEDCGVADHLLLNSLKAQKDELINRLSETISSVKNISNNKQNNLVDTQFAPQDDTDCETLLPCSDVTFPPGTEDVVLPEELPLVDTKEADLGVIRDQNDTVACISTISGIPLPENTYVVADRTDLDVTKDRNDTIAYISTISGIPLTEGTNVMTDRTGDLNRGTSVESDNFVQDIPETNDANNTLSIMFNDSNISTSTVVASDQKIPHNSPHDETLPPAVQILQNRDGEPKADVVSRKCEEAYASLSQILTLSNETLGHIPTKELIKAIDNQLENSLDKEKQMLESMRSQIDDDCKSFLSINNDDPLDDLLLSTSTDALEDTIVAKDTVITVDSNENTLECRNNNENQEEKVNQENVDSVKLDLSVIVIETSIPEDGLSSDDDELGGTIINVDEDEDKLLASDDEQNMKVGTKSGLKEFVSQDSNENKDNNDPKWESLRKCQTEIDFFKAVRARWKNLSKPNPREDLTYHSKRRIYNQSSYTFSYKNEYGKRPHSPENNELNTKVARRESCTYLFDTNIKNLMKNADIELSRIDSEKKLRLKELAAKQMEEEQYASATGQKFNYFQDMRRRQIGETEELLACFKYKQHCVTERTKQKIAALNEASREVRQYFEFYYCDEVNRGEVDMCLTEEEKREIIELENMLDAYNDFYKPT